MLLSKMINQHALQAIASYFLTVHALRAVANSNVLACYYLEIAKYLLMIFLTSYIVVGNTAQCRPSGLCGSIVRFSIFFHNWDQLCICRTAPLGGLVMWWWEVFELYISTFEKKTSLQVANQGLGGDNVETEAFQASNLYFWKEDITCRINFQCSRRSGMGLITCSRKHSGNQFVLWKRSSTFSTLEKKTLLLIGKRW